MNLEQLIFTWKVQNVVLGLFASMIMLQLTSGGCVLFVCTSPDTVYFHKSKTVLHLYLYRIVH